MRAGFATRSGESQCGRHQGRADHRQDESAPSNAKRGHGHLGPSGARRREGEAVLAAGRDAVEAGVALADPVFAEGLVGALTRGEAEVAAGAAAGVTADAHRRQTGAEPQ